MSTTSLDYDEYDDDDVHYNRHHGGNGGSSKSSPSSSSSPSLLLALPTRYFASAAGGSNNASTMMTTTLERPGTAPGGVNKKTKEKMMMTTTRAGTMIPSTVASSSSSSSSSPSSSPLRPSLSKHLNSYDEDRLVLMAKYPDATEVQIRQMLLRRHHHRHHHQYQQQQQQQQQLDRQQKRKLSKTMTTTTTTSTSTSSNATPSRRMSSRQPGPFSTDTMVQTQYDDNETAKTKNDSNSNNEKETIGNVNSSSSSTTDPKTLILDTKTLENVDLHDIYEDDEELESPQQSSSSSSFTVWQQASGEGTNEAYEQLQHHRSIQRQWQQQQKQQNEHHVSFSSLPPSPENRKATLRRGSTAGMFGFAANLWMKLFPEKNTASITPVSSGISVDSENNFEDVRSIGTGSGVDSSKSYASRASLPSYTSDKTPKMSNLTTHDEDGKEEDSGSSKPFFTTRRGVAVICLVLIVIIAMLVTILAAVVGIRTDNQKAESNTLNIDDTNLSNEQNIPMFPSVPGEPDDMTLHPSPTPTSSAYQSPTGSPTQFQVVDGPEPTPETSPPIYPTQSTSTLSPTAIPTAAPTTLSPTMMPTTMPTTSSPSSSPTPVKQFEDWVWSNQGPSILGTDQGERFGQTVAMSDDGDVLAIGAPYSSSENGLGQSGAVFVYEWETKTESWIPRGTLLGRNEGDQFGSSVAISSDGSVIAVSEPTYSGNAGSRSGNVRVFVYTTSNGYVPLGQDLEGDDATDHFGIGLALSKNGRRLAVGAPYHDNNSKPGKNEDGNNRGNKRLVSGQVKVFDWSEEGNEWIQLNNEGLKGVAHLDWYGWSVGLNDDGSLLCVGAPRNLEHGGYCICYQPDPDNPSSDWRVVGEPILNEVRPLRYDDNFGSTVKVSSDPSGIWHRVAIGSPGKNVDALDSGMVLVYELNPRDGADAEWRQLGSSLVEDLPGDKHEIGSSIDIKGDLLAVSSPGHESGGKVYLYQYQPEQNEWIRSLQDFDNSSEIGNFGIGIALTMDGRLAVGSTETESSDLGRVTVYQMD